MLAVMPYNSIKPGWTQEAALERYEVSITNTILKNASLLRVLLIELAVPLLALR